jgi:hypothetical protein
MLGWTDSFVALPKLTYSKKIPYLTAVFTFKLLEILFFLVQNLRSICYWDMVDGGCHPKKKKRKKRPPKKDPFSKPF